MNKIHIAFSCFIICIVIFSCNRRESYAELQKKEKALIANYISRHGIEVISKLPAYGEPWGEKQYYHAKDGIYFHLVSPGTGDTIMPNTKVLPRFYKYTLEEKPDTVYRDWNTIDFQFPSKPFQYATSDQPCRGWHEAVLYMKRKDAEALLIIPSEFGFYDDISSVTPMGYRFKIKFE